MSSKQNYLQTQFCVLNPAGICKSFSLYARETVVGVLMLLSTYLNIPSHIMEGKTWNLKTITAVLKCIRLG